MPSMLMQFTHIERARASERERNKGLERQTEKDEWLRVREGQMEREGEWERVE